MNIEDNCMYKTLSSFFSTKGLNIDPYELFFLYGGQEVKFEIDATNELMPIPIIRACNIDTKKLECIFGIRLTPQVLNLDELKSLLSESRNQKFCFLVECYKLSFNQKTFKKNYGKHWIILAYHDDQNVSFYDNEYEGVETFENIYSARLLSEGVTNFKYTKINNIQNKEEIIKCSIIESFLKFNSNMRAFQCDLTNYLTIVNDYSEQERDILLFLLIKEFRKPDSLLMGKSIQGDYFMREFSFNGYMQIYYDWEVILKEIVKLSGRKTTVENIIEKIDRVHQVEVTNNRKMIEILM